MFAVIYQFKFPGVSEAKVAAGFCSESLGGKIAEYDFLGLNILISKDGDLNIHVKFEDAKALKKFEDDSEKLLVSSITNWCLISSKTNKPCRIPKEIVEVFS